MKVIQQISTLSDGFQGKHCKYINGQMIIHILILDMDYRYSCKNMFW